MRGFRTALGLVSLFALGACATNEHIDWRGGTQRARTWQTFTTMNGGHGHAPTIAIGNFVAVLSGGGDCTGSSPNVTWYHSSNVSNDLNIQPLTNMPRTAAGGAFYDGRVYFFGGCTGNSNDAETFVFDRHTGGWATRSPMSSARYGMAVAEIDGKIYAAGGAKWNGQGAPPTLDPTFEVYDPVLDTWTELPRLPTARVYAGGAAIDGKFYVIGGENADASQIYDVVEVYDTATGLWGTAASMPTARSTGAAALDGRIYVAGGHTAAGANASDVVEVYDPFTDSWSTSDPLPTPRRWTQPVGADGVLFVPGGIIADGNTTTTFEAYVPADAFIGGGFWEGECGGGGGGSCGSTGGGGNHHGCDVATTGAAGAPALLAALGGFVAFVRRRRAG